MRGSYGMEAWFQFAKLNVSRHGSIFLSFVTSEVQQIQTEGSILADINWKLKINGNTHQHRQRQYNVLYCTFWSLLLLKVYYILLLENEFKNYFVREVTRCEETTFAQLTFRWSYLKTEIEVKEGAQTMT